MQDSMILEVADAKAQSVVWLQQVWERLLFILRGAHIALATSYFCTMTSLVL
jgi:hypothetical protein